MMGKYGWFVGLAYAIVLGGMLGFLWISLKQAKKDELN